MMELSKWLYVDDRGNLRHMAGFVTGIGEFKIADKLVFVVQIWSGYD